MASAPARLFTRWEALGFPRAANAWTAHVVSETGVRVAKTGTGGAALLVPTEESGTEAFGLKTSHIEYHPHRHLTVEHEGEAPSKGLYAILECHDPNVELNRLFLRVAEGLVSGMEAASKTSSFDAEVRTVFELFRSLSRAGNRSAQGLWAELVIAACAKDPQVLVTAWHSDPMDLHDFVADGGRLEVKSSVRGLHEHEFSLEQLEHLPDKTLVASVLLTESDTGVTVFELLDGLVGRLPNVVLASRAEAIVAAALGDGWRDAAELRFDVESALASLKLWSAAEVPQVPGPIPAAVRAVRFRADLSGVPAKGEAEVLVRANSVASSMLPFVS